MNDTHTTPPLPDQKTNPSTKNLAKASSAKRKEQLPIYKRATVPPVMVFTERDLRVLVSLYKYRFLTTEHIEALEYFSPTRSLTKKCKTRLQKLFHNKFVARVPVAVYRDEGSKHIVYSLDERGCNEVGRVLNIQPPKITWLKVGNRAKDESHLEHDLSVNNVWVILDSLSRSGYFELTNGLNLYQFKTTAMKSKVPFIKRGSTIKRKEPDAFFALQFPDKPKPFYFFFEQDQGTKAKMYWVEKVKAYLDFRKGRSEEYYGTRHFRVLAKTIDKKRMNELMKWTKEAGGDEYFWFTTDDRVDIWNPTYFLEPIWQVVGKPGEYSLNITSF